MAVGPRSESPKGAAADSGSFMVHGTPTDGMDWGEIRGPTLSAADKFCTDRGQQMQQVASATHGTRHWGQQELELPFRHGR